MNEGEADIPYGKDAPLAKAEGPNGRTPHLPSRELSTAVLVP